MRGWIVLAAVLLLAGCSQEPVPYDYDLSAYIELGTYSAIPYLPYGDTGRDTVEPYDLVILDLNLPGMDGLELLRRIRSERPELRVLILSARAQLSDKVAGLDLGADDYLTKPFDLEELEARVRTLLRREFVQQAPLVQAGPLALDTVAREISVRGDPLSLTPREFAILEQLMLCQGRWLSQEALMEHVWEADANPFSNAVRMHISSLRKKLRDKLGYDPIQTKVGQGYRLTGEEPI